MMFISQTISEGVPKKQPGQETPQSKSAVVNLWSQSWNNFIRDLFQ